MLYFYFAFCYLLLFCLKSHIHTHTYKYPKITLYILNAYFKIFKITNPLDLNFSTNHFTKKSKIKLFLKLNLVKDF